MNNRPVSQTTQTRPVTWEEAHHAMIEGRRIRRDQWTPGSFMSLLDGCPRLYRDGVLTNSLPYEGEKNWGGWEVLP